ncbi:MAG: NAD-dependent epimerase/dehydratase family protein [Clostridium sp.]|nr:NAD-dependent epimerase/dehydratase family protein [Acetatifactor muris]MCM1525797.1 NAD-dependent epimerase/dehydratase family protein [Bacteroides sp.]MCM1564053.1 NAD-dependent epimerase/dehydratase family protein [Clostridium sp.]
MKTILITGVNSYIGNAVERYLAKYNARGGSELYRVEKVSLRDDRWRERSFAACDTLLHVAGIAHADVSNVSEERKALYYKVNRDLTEQVALKARAEGVSQFIFLSSVIVYGESAGPGGSKHITDQTVPAPANFYGDSKLQAEQRLQALETEDFHVAILRPPMIYGKGCRGNFAALVKLASQTPVFPRVDNRRSMLYIENLAEFIRLLTETGMGGMFWPQNAEYVSTADMVCGIGRVKGRRIRLWRTLNLPVRVAAAIPGRIGKMARKAFGSLTIDLGLSDRGIADYRICSLEESIKRSI